MKRPTKERRWSERVRFHWPIYTWCCDDCGARHYTRQAIIKILPKVYEPFDISLLTFDLTSGSISNLLKYITAKRMPLGNNVVNIPKIQGVSSVKDNNGEVSTGDDA